MSRSAADAWLSTLEAAELLGVSHRTVLKLIDRGELDAEVTAPTRRAGRRSIRLQRAAVDRFIARARLAPGDLRALYVPGAGIADQ